MLPLGFPPHPDCIIRTSQFTHAATDTIFFMGKYRLPLFVPFDDRLRAESGAYTASLAIRGIELKYYRFIFHCKSLLLGYHELLFFLLFMPIIHL
jgi:hypothetical protein